MMVAAVDSGADQRSPRIRTAGSASSAWPIKKRGGGSYLIRETDDADLEPAAKQVGPPAQVDQRWQTGDADRDADGSLAPRAAETVVYDDHDIDPGQRRQPAAQRLRTPIRILRQQKHSVGAVHRRHVRLVHSGIRHDEPEPVFNDQHTAARSYHANQLRQDDLYKPRVFVDIRRKRDSLCGRFDRREIDEATLGLRNNFLRNDKHVSGGAA